MKSHDFNNREYRKLESWLIKPTPVDHDAPALAFSGYSTSYQCAKSTHPTKKNR